MSINNFMVFASFDSSNANWQTAADSMGSFLTQCISNLSGGAIQADASDRGAAKPKPNALPVFKKVQIRKGKEATAGEQSAIDQMIINMVINGTLEMCLRNQFITAFGSDPMVADSFGTSLNVDKFAVKLGKKVENGGGGDVNIISTFRASEPSVDIFDLSVDGDWGIGNTASAILTSIANNVFGINNVVLSILGPLAGVPGTTPPPLMTGSWVINAAVSPTHDGTPVAVAMGTNDDAEPTMTWDAVPVGTYVNVGDFSGGVYGMGFGVSTAQLIVIGGGTEIQIGSTVTVAGRNAAGTLFGVRQKTNILTYPGESAHTLPNMASTVVATNDTGGVIPGGTIVGELRVPVFGGVGNGDD